MLRGRLGTKLRDALSPGLGDELGVVLDVDQGPALREAPDAVLGVALSLGDELGTSLGAFSPSEVGERLGRINGVAGSEIRDERR